jgi:multiple sugar transport system ATP-binding protein
MGAITISNVHKIYGAMPPAGQNVVALFRERAALSPGDRVATAPNHERIHIFDSEGGQRIEPFASRLAS